MVVPILFLLVGSVAGCWTTDEEAINDCRHQALCVSSSGILMKDNQPYFGAGVNYFNAFNRTLMDPKDTSYHYGFEVLAKYHIPFARFMAGGYWPAEYNLYFQDKERYFQLLDGVVKAAEDHGVGLIPSLFWHSATVPDLVGEPRSSWGDTESRTISFMRQYVKEVVTRYKDSEAIWGWEFGNEYNLDIDLPNAQDHRPPVHPELGTARERSDQDDLTLDMMQTAYREFAKEVRTYDSDAIVIGGNSMPRPSAWNQNAHNTFDQDTESQFAEALAAQNVDPLSMVSVHFYLTDDQRFNRPFHADEWLRLTMKAALEAQKPLFIGEFGVSDAEKEGGMLDPELAKQKFEQLLVSIEEARVPLSAVWVYDYYGQREWNVTADNGRAYQLEQLQALNERFTARAQKETTS